MVNPSLCNRLNQLVEPKKSQIIGNMRFFYTWSPAVQEKMRRRYVKYNSTPIENLTFLMRRDKEMSEIDKFHRQYGCTKLNIQ